MEGTPRMRLIVGAALAFLVQQAVSAWPASAEERPARTGWEFSIGAATIAAPAFMGSDAYALSVVPVIEARHGERFFASFREGIGYALVNSSGWKAGPVIRYGGGRDEDGSNPFRVGGARTTALNGLGNVDPFFSAGIFAEYATKTLSLKSSARTALSGHGGSEADLQLSFVRRGEPWILSVGPAIRFADRRYVNTYFGVTPAQSAASGLPVFEGSGGLVAGGLRAVAVRRFGGDATLSMLASYDRLTGDVAASPLVRERGSPDQLMAGISLGWSFR